MTAHLHQETVMPRPREHLRRPDRIAIRQGLVICRYNSCFYRSGPHLDREHAVSAAIEHYEQIHHRPQHHRRRS